MAAENRGNTADSVRRAVTIYLFIVKWVTLVAKDVFKWFGSCYGLPGRDVTSILREEESFLWVGSGGRHAQDCAGRPVVGRVTLTGSRGTANKRTPMNSRMKEVLSTESGTVDIRSLDHLTRTAREFLLLLCG